MRPLTSNHTRRTFTCGLVFCAILGSFQKTSYAQVSSESSEVRPTKLMEFTGFDWEDVISRLDYLDHYLRSNSGVRAYVFVYGGKRENAPDSLNARVRCVEEYLGNRRRTPRLVFEVLKGGYRERITVEFWISSEAGPKPKPTPTVSKRSVRYRHRHDKTIPLLCNN